MLIIAKTVKGKEYYYGVKTAHKVSMAGSEKILEVLNRVRYQLGDGQTWHIYEIDRYDTAYDYAEFQKFTIRKGIVKEIFN